MAVEKVVAESGPDPLREIRSEKRAAENEPDDLLDMERDGIVAVGVVNEAIIKAVGYRRDEQNIYTHNRGDLPDLSAEGVGPRVHHLRYGTTKTNGKSHATPQGHEPLVNSIVKDIFTAIGDVHNHAAEPVEPDSGVVDHKGGVVEYFGFGLHAMGPCTESVQ